MLQEHSQATGELEPVPCGEAFMLRIDAVDEYGNRWIAVLRPFVKCWGSGPVVCEGGRGQPGGLEGQGCKGSIVVKHGPESDPRLKALATLLLTGAEVWLHRPLTSSWCTWDFPLG